MTSTTLIMPDVSREGYPAPRRCAPALLDLWWFEHFQAALARTQSRADLEAVRHRIWTSFGRGQSAALNRRALAHLREAFLRRREQLRRRDEDPTTGYHRFDAGSAEP